MPDGRLAPYDLSVGTPPFQQCPACGVDWAPTLWLVVDADHRPDLLSRIQDGALCVFRCGACANSINVNSPFLVLRSRAPRLLYSPSPGTTSLDDHNQVVHALSTLKEVMADCWNDKLVEELTVVAPALLPTELTSDTTAPGHSVADLVDAFVQADTPWKQQYVLAFHPGLFAADAEAVLERRIDQARQAGDAAFASLRVQRGMLAGCRRAGVATIRGLLPSPQVYEPAAPLNELLLATAHAMRSGQRDAALVGLFEATRLVTQMDNPLLWTELQLTLAEIDAASEPRKSRFARQAYEAVATAAFPCGPWLARSAGCRARLATSCRADPGSADDEELAIRYYEAAVEAFEALGDADQLLVLYDTLGLLHSRRTQGDRESHLEAALRCFQAAARCADRDYHPSNWAAMQFNVGNAFLERVTGDPLANVDQAIHHLEQAASVQSELAEPERLREAMDRLQTAYQKRMLAQHARDPRSPDLLRALRALEKHDWEDALAAYRSAIATTEEMLASVYSEEKRREVFGDFGTAYSAAAYVCFRLGRLNEAIALLEAGRSRVLSEEVLAFDVVEEKLPEPLREELKEARQQVHALRTTKVVFTRPDGKAPAATLIEKANRNAWLGWLGVLEKIKTVAPEAIPAEIGERELLDLVPEGGALVLPVLSIVGCCVLVVPHGRSTLACEDLLWIDSFTDNHLIALLDAWSASQNAADRAERRQAVSGMCERLWDIFACPVAERLQALNIAPGAPVVILPQGGLGLLPLHAAAPKPDSSGGFLDGYAVSYAPSAYLLSVMRRRALDSATATDGLLGAVDPLGDLHYGRAEGAWVSSLFPPEHVTLLEGAAASGHNLIDAVVNKKYVHLSCHAFYTTNGGNYAGLYLAHDVASLSNEEFAATAERRLPLKDFFFAGRRWIVLNLKLARCRLVTLSACESGRTDIQQPDEFLGLPAAFLRAGAAAVVSTLWRVDDVAAMLLTRRLYEGLVNDRLSPACALRKAQQWLRDATNQSLYRLYSALRGQDDAPLSAQQLDRELRRHAFGAPNERPFSNPYYWAAFVVFGSG